MTKINFKTFSKFLLSKNNAETTAWYVGWYIRYTAIMFIVFTIDVDAFEINWPELYSFSVYQTKDNLKGLRSPQTKTNAVVLVKYISDIRMPCVDTAYSVQYVL